MGYGKQGQRPTGNHHENIFGPVPTMFEVQKAMSDLQRFIDGSPSTPSKPLESSEMLNHDTRITESSGHRRVRDAYRLLKSEPSVQKMVVSISTDKAVWDAILSNKAVQELRSSLSSVRENRRHGQQISQDKTDFVALMMKWILGIAMSKLGEVITKFGLLVTEMFKPDENEIPTPEKLPEFFEENVRSSMVLSVVVLLIVVVSRG